MKKDPDQNSADSAEIEALITRLERGQLRDGDAQLLARLLRLLLRLVTLLQQKNASLSRLKRLLFGPRSDKREVASSSSGAESEGESDSASSTSTENFSPDTPKGARSQSQSRKGGHGRMGAEAYTGALGPDATEEVITMIHSVTGGIFRSVDMMIPWLLELKQRNEKKLAEGSVKMQDLVKTATSRLMI